MKKFLCLVLTFVILLTATLPASQLGFAFSAFAEDPDDVPDAADLFSYYIDSATDCALIDTCSEEAEGTVVIPAVIDGHPVIVGSPTENGFFRVFEKCSKVKKVIVSEGIKTIGPWAFENNTSIEEIVLPETLTSIMTGAFSGCTSLHKVNFPKSLTELGAMCLDGTPIYDDPANWIDGCFYYDQCFISAEKNTAQSIQIGNKAWMIATGAFTDTSCDTITFTESVTTISSNPVILCAASVNKIQIPASVIKIGDSFFSWASVGEITVDKNNPNYCSENGVLFNKEKTKLLKFASSAANQDGIYAIPEGVEEIGVSAFELARISGVVFPKSLKEIGANAFASSTIKSLTVPAGVHLNFAFARYCSQLETAQIENGVKSIPYGCFDSCFALSEIEIPDTVTSIGGRAFEYCTSLKTVTLPKNLENIELANGIDGIIFTGCSALETIELAEENAYYTVKDGILYTKDMKYLLRCPPNSGKTSVKVPDSVEVIYDLAFEGCASVKQVILPEGIKEILSDAFKGCSSLTQCAFPTSLQYIGENAFMGCALDETEVPYNVTSIGYAAFGFDKDYNKIDGFSIICAKGSQAETYAKAFEIPYKTVGATPDNYRSSPVIPDKTRLELAAGVRFKEGGNALYTTKPFSLSQFGYEFYDITIEFRHNAVTIKGEDPIPTKYQLIFGEGETTKTVDFVLMGDVNGDGFQNKDDIAIVQDHNNWAPLSIYQKQAADLNCDGVVDKDDVALLQAGIADNDYPAVDSLTPKTEIKNQFFTHQWDDGTVTKAPTCVKDGVKTFTCVVCKETKTEPVKATDHKPVTDKAVPATCTKDGKTEGSHCSVCGEVLTAQKTVKATGHQWDNGKITTAPTCVEDGVKTFTCTVCGQQKTEKAAATGEHAFSEWTVTKEATADEEGEESRLCAVCLTKETRAIPKLTPTEPEQPTKPDYTPGDVDGDGKITSADARLALRRSVMLEDYPEGSAAYLACDVDHDGKVTSADARLILRGSVGLEDVTLW